MKLERKVRITFGALFVIVVILGLIDQNPSKLTMDEYMNNCHVTDTC